MATWESNSTRYFPVRPAPPLVGEHRYLDFDVSESWFFQLLASSPDPPAMMRMPPVYHSSAAEIHGKQGLYANTYDFQGSRRWYEIGPQVPTASGWRPDCAVGYPTNVRRTLPPRDGQHPIILEPSELMRYVGTSRVAGYQQWTDDPTQGIQMTTCVFPQEGIGASCSRQVGIDCIPSLKSWIIGKDLGRDHPAFLMEGGILHALLLVEQRILRGCANSPFSAIQAGTWKTNRRLIDWFNDGELPFQSAATPDIIATPYRLVDVLPCPLLITSLPLNFFEGATARGIRSCDLLSMASSRLYSLIVPQLLPQRGTRLARIPWTQEETKSYCK